MRNIVVVALIIIFVFSLCAPCFSAAVPSVEAIDLFGTLYSAYLVAHGLDAVVSNNGIISDGTDPLPAASWRELWQQNFDTYAPLVDDSIESAADWVEGYLQDLRAEAAFGSGSSPSPSPDPEDNGVIGFQFSAQLSEFFDNVTNLIFKDKYGLSGTPSGFQHSSGSFDEPLTSVVVSDAFYDGVELTSITNGFLIGRYDWFVRNLNASSPVYAWRGPSGWTVYLGSASSFTIQIGNSGNSETYSSSSSPNSNLYFPYYRTISISYSDQQWQNVNRISYNGQILVSDPLISSSSDSSLLTLSPQDKYKNSPIPVPDTDADDYVPQPQTIIVNVPWPDDVEDPDFTDLTDSAVVSVVDPVLEASTSNTLEPVIPSTPPSDPSPVMPPFLPSQPPTFNFNLGGIWYYVVRWVNSVRSGAALIFSVFNNIPPAMFYPIFGSAVAVIVIGVWRRFVS